MKIKQILSRETVLSTLQSRSKAEALTELAGLLTSRCPGVSADEIAGVLLEREKLGSTGIGNGVAIPHGKIPQLTQIVSAFGRSVAGISFDAQDGKPVHLFFVLLAPENAASLHLKALARLSRLLKDVHFRNKLMEAQDEDELFKEIIGEDEKF